jgi:heme/copper-type cytochrome/quinol oxidase subunit 2
VQDGPRHIDETRHYSLILFIIIWIVCGVAVIIAVALLYFNFKNREIRYKSQNCKQVLTRAYINMCSGCSFPVVVGRE